jgi:hypothetical protein
MSITRRTRPSTEWSSSTTSMRARSRSFVMRLQTFFPNRSM